MKKILIIGGGFFGLYLSEYFAKQGCEVMLYEKESDFMQRASYVNQARVHNGYHYPRSILTALRSRISFPRFVEEFEGCIDDTFDKYYMISNLLSKISAKQFEKFCHRIGAVCEPAPARITSLVNPHYVESVFTTKEASFDATKLKDMMLERICSAGVNYKLNQKVQSVTEKNSKLLVKSHSMKNTEELDCIDADEVFNCTYSMINQVINNSDLTSIPLKHELTEMVLVEVPEELKNTGITVMDGPFFSVMPFPSRNLHSFSHVRYTPHYSWNDIDKENHRSAHNNYDITNRKSAWPHMLHDAKRYIPVLSECRAQESIWEVKTVLPRSESNDSRPILFKPNHGLKGFHNIMGGKIDNVYDVIEVIEKTGLASG